MLSPFLGVPGVVLPRAVKAIVVRLGMFPAFFPMKLPVLAMILAMAPAVVITVVAVIMGECGASGRDDRQDSSPMASFFNILDAPILCWSSIRCSSR